ncbi:hypothetical protein Scep_021722 [Stephania cephalantha]|uniref:Uncharacterized protein n=1 Tax=Stephania cephalantha TaxID=152367 RepID=A0AAP0HX33_9MAGN
MRKNGLKSRSHFTMIVVSFSKMIVLTGENAVALEDALEEVEKIDSSSESDCEVECTTEMPPAAEDVEATSTISRSRTTTPDGNGSPSKKKKKVGGYTYLAD